MLYKHKVWDLDDIALLTLSDDIINWSKFSSLQR